MSAVPITLIVILIFIVTIIVFILLSKGAKTSPLYNKLPVYTNATLNNRCSKSGTVTLATDPTNYTPQPCEDGLECVLKSSTDIYGICRASLGSTCTTVYDCVPDATVCNGTCITGKYGGFHETAYPQSLCKTGYSAFNGVCLIANGFTGCNAKGDCAEGRCSTNVPSGLPTCVAEKPLGSACVYDVHDPNPCGNNDCTDGFCQPPGATTGNEGSLCTIPGNSSLNNFSCTPFAKCSYDLVNMAPDGYGRCRNSAAGLGQSCGYATSVCRNPLICNGGICDIPTDGSKYYAKSYTCRRAGSTDECPDGYKCASSGKCLGDATTSICTTNEDCASNNCGTVPTLMKWSPDIYRPDSTGFGTWSKILDLTTLASPGIGAMISSYTDPYNIIHICYLPIKNATTLYLIEVYGITYTIKVKGGATVKGIKYVSDNTIGMHCTLDGKDFIHRYVVDIYLGQVRADGKVVREYETTPTALPPYSVMKPIPTSTTSSLGDYPVNGTVIIKTVETQTVTTTVLEVFPDYYLYMGTAVRTVTVTTTPIPPIFISGTTTSSNGNIVIEIVSKIVDGDAVVITTTTTTEPRIQSDIYILNGEFGRTNLKAGDTSATNDLITNTTTKIVTDIAAGTVTTTTTEPSPRTIETFDFFDMTPTVFGFGSMKDSIVYYAPISQLSDKSLITNYIDMVNYGWTYTNPLLYMKFNSDTSFIYAFVLSTVINSIDGTIQFNSTQGLLQPQGDTSKDIYSANGGMYIYGFDVDFGATYPPIEAITKTDIFGITTTQYVSNIQGGYSLTRNRITASPPNSIPLATNPIEPNPTKGAPYFLPGSVNSYNFTNAAAVAASIASSTNTAPLTNLPTRYPMTMTAYDNSLFVIAYTCK